MSQEFHFTMFINGFVRKIDKDLVQPDTWVLTDYDTKSPVVLHQGHEYILKAGWIASEGLVYGEMIRRPNMSRNVHVMYGSLPNVQVVTSPTITLPSSQVDGQVFNIKYNDTMTQIRCDGNTQHDWKTYNSGFSEFEYCSVCDRKKS